MAWWAAYFALSRLAGGVVRRALIVSASHPRVAIVARTVLASTAFNVLSSSRTWPCSGHMHRGCPMRPGYPTESCMATQPTWCGGLLPSCTQRCVTVVRRMQICRALSKKNRFQPGRPYKRPDRLTSTSPLPGHALQSWAHLWATEMSPKDQNYTYIAGWDGSAPEPAPPNQSIIFAYSSLPPRSLDWADAGTHPRSPTSVLVLTEVSAEAQTPQPQHLLGKDKKKAPPPLERRKAHHVISSNRLQLRSCLCHVRRNLIRHEIRLDRGRTPGSAHSYLEVIKTE